MRKLALLAFLAATDLGAADPRIGSWTLTSAQSVMEPPRKISVTPLGGRLHVVISGDTRMDFTVDERGRETAVQGVPAFNQIEWRRVGKNEVEIKEKKDGVLVAIIRESLSKNHEELTVTTSEKGHSDQTAVLVRSGGVNAPANPFAGEWTEDLGKTRLRQGLVVHIEADGENRVRFSGEFSYTAAFDGKEYILKNSYNDTVTLVLVDPRTVDSIYKRGDEITGRDRWVISADGHQATVTTTSVLENGQHVREKLLFRKQ